MKIRSLTLLIVLVAMPAGFLIPEVVSGAGPKRSAAKKQKPLVLAHYYMWYSTGFGPYAKWSHWASTNASEIYPKGCDPERIIFPPAIRQICSFAYPLIGPYDSDNAEVARWHMRLAKAAGIDGFLVDWWATGSWQDPKGLTFKAFERAVLPAAEKEGIKVCLFDETPQFVNNLDQCIAWAIQFLRKYKDSPAYLKIDGKPVYCIYQAGLGKLKPQEGQRFMREVQAGVGPVYWIVDRITYQLGNKHVGTGLAITPGWEKISEIDAFCMYGTFSAFRKYDRSTLARYFKGVARQVHRLDRKVMLPVHPGMDNRKVQLDPYAKKQGKPHWTIDRRDGQTLRDYLRAATEAGADIISITSWNEWLETTNIEPAITSPDPYLYLKIIAEHQGNKFVSPSLPQDKVLDPAIRPILKKHRTKR